MEENINKQLCPFSKLRFPNTASNADRKDMTI